MVHKLLEDSICCDETILPELQPVAPDTQPAGTSGVLG
jgi:hypothetical protein